MIIGWTDPLNFEQLENGIAASTQASHEALVDEDYLPSVRKQRAEELIVKARAFAVDEVAARYSYVANDFISAAKSVEAAEDAHEASVNYSRLGALQTEIAASARGVSADGVGKMVDTILAGNDYYKVRALVAAAPDLRTRMMASEGGATSAAAMQASDLEARCAARLAELEPADLRNKRQAAQDKRNALYNFRLKADTLRFKAEFGGRPWPELREVLNPVTTTTTEVKPGHWITERSGGTGIFG